MKLTPIYTKLCVEQGKAISSLSKVLDHFPSKSHSKLSKLCQTYTLHIAIRILDFGFPKCPICSGDITGTRGKEFKTTCSWKCAVEYRKASPDRLEKRQAFITRIRDNYKSGKTTWKVQSETSNTIVCECSKCNKTYSRTAKYFLENGCRCQCGKKISQAQRISSEDFENLLKPKQIVSLSSYKGMNARIKVKCLVCNTEWKTFAGNLKLHGCPTCAPFRLREKNA